MRCPREIIADSVKYMVNAHCAHAMVAISNCDTITPGMFTANAMNCLTKARQRKVTTGLRVCAAFAESADKGAVRVVPEEV